MTRCFLFVKFEDSIIIFFTIKSEFKDLISLLVHESHDLITLLTPQSSGTLVLCMDYATA